MIHSTSPAQTRTACRLDPLLAACPATLARQEAETGAAARESWQAAVRARPRDASSAVQAALAAEAGGDLAGAERLLLATAARNRLWLPRWTLASFYLRHDRMAEFWPWLRLALERSHGDRRALFRLCRQAGADTAWLLERILPPDPPLRAQHLLYLLEERLLDDFNLAARNLFSALSPDLRRRYGHVLRWSADALLTHDRAGAALEMWNLLAAERLIPYAPLSPDRPLTNGRFEAPLREIGFDWRFSASEGVEAVPGVAPGVLKIRLSGRQPERMVLLRQAVWLPANRAYRFRCEARTRGWGRPESGLYWRAGLPGGLRLDSSPAWLGSEEWETVEMLIRPRPSPGLVWVELAAERRPGFTRPEGEAWIRAATLEPGT